MTFVVAFSGPGCKSRALAGVLSCSDVYWLAARCQRHISAVRGLVVVSPCGAARGRRAGRDGFGPTSCGSSPSNK